MGKNKEKNPRTSPTPNQTVQWIILSTISNTQRETYSGEQLKRRELPQNSGLIKNTDLWSFRWFQSWHLMRRSRLQAICNMTWGARYSTAPRPTNERAGVSGYQPALYRPTIQAEPRSWHKQSAGSSRAVESMWQCLNYGGEIMTL